MPRYHCLHVLMWSTALFFFIVGGFARSSPAAVVEYHGTDVLFIFAPRIVVAVEQVKLTSQAADGRRLLSVYI